MQKKGQITLQRLADNWGMFKMITTHFNNVKIQSAEYSNYFWNILHFCSEGQAKNMGKCKNAIICLGLFSFEKCFKIDVIVSLHKRIICYLLWSIYWLANGQSVLFRKCIFNYLTRHFDFLPFFCNLWKYISFWFLTH